MLTNISSRFVRSLLQVTLLSLCFGSVYAQQKSLTLCWAAWDPANALVELSKDFTSKSGIQMKYEFYPWTDFTDKMTSELSNKGKLCDLVVGDSQWIGMAATKGHYVKLNEFLDRNSIRMTDFSPGTVEGYTTWPKGSKDYWALPAMGDAVAWTYRKDWFSKPEIQKDFMELTGRKLEPPTTWKELIEVAKFFQGRKIDGKKVYGAAIYTEGGSEGITMGVTSAMYANGTKYSNPNSPYGIEGFTNGRSAVEALQTYRDLYACCTPPGHSNAYMTEDLDTYRSGQVAMQMNFIAFFPGIARDPIVGGDKTGFFANPKMASSGTALGGQGISVVSYSEKREAALEYIKWFSQGAVQQRWWDLGGFTCHDSVLKQPSFAISTSYAKVYLDSMQIAQDFWQEPSYGQLLTAMQKRLYEYVVLGNGTPETSLNGLVGDWNKVFESTMGPSKVGGSEAPNSNKLGADGKYFDANLIWLLGVIAVAVLLTLYLRNRQRSRQV